MEKCAQGFGVTRSSSLNFVLQTSFPCLFHQRENLFFVHISLIQKQTVRRLVIDDKGLLSHVLAAYAKAQGTKPDGLVSLALMTIASLAGQQDAESRKAFDAVASFVGDWRAPNGPITISLAPAKGASLADLGTLMMPNALRQMLGLQVDYAGTRPGAALAGPTAK